MMTADHVERLLPSAREVNAVLNRKIETLPSVSVVMMRLFQLTRDEDASFGDLVKLIETDPGLCATVLRRVNSAAYGFRRRISSIMEAVVILGFNTIRELSLEILLYEQLIRRKFKSSRYVSFWRHSLVVAYSSRALARQIGFKDEDAAYCAGLLHDIGKIILESCGNIAYSEVYDQLGSTPRDPVEQEIRLLGIGHDALGGYFCHRWGFPNPIALAVAYHHRRFKHLGLADADMRLIAIVALSNFIALTQGLGMDEMHGQTLMAPELNELIEIDKIDLNALLSETDRNMKETAEFYQFQFPDAPTLRHNLLQANLSLGLMNSRMHYLGPDESAEENADNPGQTLTQPHRSLIPDEIKKLTLEAIQRDFAFDQVYILDSAPENRQLVLSDILDNGRGTHPPIGAAIDISQNIGALLTCLRQNIPTVMTGETLRERELLALFGAPEIGWAPIARNGHVSGLIGMDNSVSKRKIGLNLLAGIVGIAREMGVALEHAQLFEQFKRRALLDGLTQIYNRGAIDECLAQAFERSPQSLAVGMVDIDYFKKFNDVFGHATGDEVLKIVASLMKKYSRPQDQVGRYGGEEFIFVLNGANFEQALLFAERLRMKTEKLGQILEKRYRNHFLTISVGVAVYQAGLTNHGQLIELADRALYAAKRTGRNRAMGYREGGMVGHCH
jgi:diguanylate cyclase (GGDEF)-like protein/putative nucleotidyltransferase with HDIG domain